MKRRPTAKIYYTICLIIIAGLVIFFVLQPLTRKIAGPNSPLHLPSFSTPETSGPLPAQALLNDNNYYITDSFNNCGPAALSMDLSFYGIHVSQQALADILRPDNNTTGKGDDKSTSPDEVAAQAEAEGLVAYFRPNGSINLLKNLIAAGFPVMTRTLLATSSNYAHYRVIKGYNDTTDDIIDEDGMQGETVPFSYDDFLTLWKPFNYEYIVLAPPDKQAEVESVLGQDIDATTAWQEAAQTATQALALNASDTAAEFDLSVADYYTGDYASSVQAFEKAEPTLSEYALWYQIEPIESFYELSNYNEVFSLAQTIFAKNPAYPELYVVEGESYLKEGNAVAAKQAFETALFYNKNLKSAQVALAALTGQTLSN